jgi:hypothetical protein
MRHIERNMCFERPIANGKRKEKTGSCYYLYINRVMSYIATAQPWQCVGYMLCTLGSLVARNLPVSHMDYVDFG